MSGGVKPFTATMNAIRIVKSEDVPAEWVLNTYGDLNNNNTSLYLASTEDTVNGGAFAVGRMYNSFQDKDEGLVVKYNNDMSIAYSKRVSELESSFMALLSVVDDGQGGCIVAGFAARGAYTYEALLIHMDSTLDILSAKTFGDDDTFDTSFEWFTKVIKDGNDFLAVGLHGQGGSNNDEEMYLVKVDINLNVIEEKDIVYNFESFRLNDITNDGQGGFIAVGEQRNDNFGGIVIKLDSQLTVTNATVLYGSVGNVEYHGVVSTGNGGAIAVGYETVSAGSSAGAKKGIIARYDTNLNLLSRSSIEEDTNSECILTGIAKQGSKYIVSGGNTDLLNSPSSGYLVSLDSNANIESSVKLDGARTDFFYDISSYGSVVYASGQFTHTDLIRSKPTIAKITGNINTLSGSLSNHDLTWSGITMQNVSPVPNMTISSRNYITRDVSFTKRTPTFADSSLGAFNFSSLTSTS